MYSSERRVYLRQRLDIFSVTQRYAAPSANDTESSNPSFYDRGIRACGIVLTGSVGGMYDRLSGRSEQQPNFARSALEFS